MIYEKYSEKHKSHYHEENILNASIVWCEEAGTIGYRITKGNSEYVNYRIETGREDLDRAWAISEAAEVIKNINIVT
jgi:hypothetical protein